MAAAARPASAQSRTPTPDELKAARELFQDAFKDEQDKRFDAALEKFQRVAGVKESASVRYRIASVLESLGRLREARDAFRALVAAKWTLPASEQEIADSSAERAHALDKKIPRLLIRLQDNPPPDARVTIDGAAVPASTTVRPIELDPGEHLVQASAPTARSSETQVTLVDGAEVAVTVVLPLLAVKPVKGAGSPLPPPPPDASPRRNNTLAYVALGAGGVLLVTGTILLAERASDISKLERACPNGVCPKSNQSALQADHDQAQLFGPLGATCLLLGLAGAGVGAYLLWFAPAPAASGAPSSGTSAPGLGGVRIAPRAIWGGAALGLDASF
jgi:tetratricopeptide (TPR) repeat protein